MTGLWTAAVSVVDSALRARVCYFIVNFRDYNVLTPWKNWWEIFVSCGGRCCFVQIFFVGLNTIFSSEIYVILWRNWVKLVV
jgi:hypothetical protein